MVHLRFVAAAGLWLALSNSAGAQGTLADYQRGRDLQSKTRDLVVNAPGPATWIDSEHFWYSRSVKGGTELVLVNAARGEKKVAFDHEKLAGALSQASGHKYSAVNLPLGSNGSPTSAPLQFEDQLRTIRFAVSGFYYRCKLEQYACVKGETVPQNTLGDRRSANPEGPGGDPEDGIEFPAPQQDAGRSGRAPRYRCTDTCPSPDGKWVAFIQDFNVYLRPSGGQAEALSHRGADGYAYALQSIAWSPDSTKLVAYRVHPGFDRQVHYIDSSPRDQIQPKHKTISYRKPGDQLDIAIPALFDVAARKEIEIDRSLFPNAYAVSLATWWKDSRAFTFEYNQRGHQVFRVIEVDAQTGKARALIDEESKTFFYYNSLGPGMSAGRRYRYDVNDGKEIIWASERDGWEHLYLYDGETGRVKNRITKGNWLVRNVDFVDTEKRQIWFEAGGIYPHQDPYFTHYCRINFDGSGLTHFTQADGTHTVSLSKDRTYYVDTWQRVDLAPVSTLRRTSDQKVILDLEKTDASALQTAGLRPPEVFVAKGRDGATDIWGIIVRPTNFDPKKKYPVIEDIYAGPQGSFVPKTFNAVQRTQALAELGFIVVQIDGMGTSNRSKAFHDVAWKNLGDAGFPDRILWHKAVAAKYPYYDITRVGIFGTSAGGQSALGALLFHPEFYKVAVSNSGCHDNRMDKIWWNEQWMSWPVGPQYAASSNVDNAYRLQGKVLIIAGELDTNVDPASSLQVVNALVRAHKHFDMLYIPGQNHGVPSLSSEHYRDDYFVRNLMGVEPPDWNRVLTPNQAAALSDPNMQGVDCSLEPKVKSESDGDHVDLRFENQTTAVRKVYWLDYNGDRIHFSTLAPGGSVPLKTYVDHLWVVTDADERCLGIYFPSPKIGVATIRK
jgi:dipeptidyl aminopeptidase/acylaminoacyl peptidase